MRPPRERTHGGLKALVVATALAAPFCGAGGGSAFGQYTAVSAWDASVGEIRSAARYNSDGTHHALLVALRELRDPALRPLFQSLIQGEHWTIQIDGILGLAELDPKRHVDPFLLSQLKGENDRSTGIAAAVGLDLVGAEQAAAMLAWDDLPPRDRVLLCAELLHRGGKPQVDMLVKLSDHRNDEVAGLASFLLVSVAEDNKPLDAFRSRFAALPAKDRAAVFIALAGAVGRFSLKDGAPFLDETLKDATIPAEARAMGLSALLPLSPEVGYRAWKVAVESDASQANRVRLALLLLAADAPLPKGAAGPLRSSGKEQDQLLTRLADAIDALAAGGDASPAFRALVATKHRPSLAAALEAAKRLDSGNQTAVLQAFGDLLEKQTRREIAPAVVELCLEALSRLAKLDPGEIGRRLQATQRSHDSDEGLADLLLLALLGADTREAAEIADAARSKATRRGASLAMILKARHSAELDAAGLAELGVIASGGGRVERPLQVQAAWLYARLSGKADQAIAAALTP